MRKNRLLHASVLLLILFLLPPSSASALRRAVRPEPFEFPQGRPVEGRTACSGQALRQMTDKAGLEEELPEEATVEGPADPGGLVRSWLERIGNPPQFSHTAFLKLLSRYPDLDIQGAQLELFQQGYQLTVPAKPFTLPESSEYVWRKQATGLEETGQGADSSARRAEVGAMTATGDELFERARKDWVQLDDFLAEVPGTEWADLRQALRRGRDTGATQLLRIPLGSLSEDRIRIYPYYLGYIYWQPKVEEYLEWARGKLQTHKIELASLDTSGNQGEDFKFPGFLVLDKAYQPEAALSQLPEDYLILHASELKIETLEPLLLVARAYHPRLPADLFKGVTVVMAFVYENQAKQTRDLIVLA